MCPLGGGQKYGGVWEGFLEGVSPGSEEVVPKVRMASATAQRGHKNHVSSKRPRRWSVSGVAEKGQGD